MTRLLLSLAAALLLTGGTAWAGPFEDAAAAYARGDYSTAFKIIQPLAAQGDARAQFSLGAMYLNGHGVSQDSTEADKWFRLSVAQGNAKAQAHLGALYAKGLGVPQDYATARQWYEQAAVQGYASAQNNLGVLYRGGHGLPQEDVRAYMWFNPAVPRLTGDEQKLAVNNRDEFARRMTSAQIAEAQRLAQQCQAQNFKDC